MTTTMVMAQPPSATQSRPSSAVMAATSSMDDISMNYDKVISLFTSRHSSELYDRHVAAIHRMCRSATNGFAIRELPKVEQVLIFTLELLRKTANSEIADATEHLIRALALPFVRRTSTDEFKMLNNISSIISTVGGALHHEMPSSIRVAAADVLASFASAYGNRPSNLDEASEEADMGTTQRQFHTNQSLVQRSSVVPRVVEALEETMCHFCLMHVAYQGARRAVMLNGGPGFAPNTGEEFIHKDVGLSMAQALLEFSYVQDNAAEAVAAGLMASMPGLLSFDIHDPAVFISLELLWNCIEFAEPGRRLGAEVSAETVEGIAFALHRLIVDFLDHGFKESDKHTRNEVLLMMIMLMDEPGFREALVAHGTTDLLTAVCVVPELAEIGGVVKPFLVTLEPPDFELRLLLWSCVVGLCADPGARGSATRGGFLSSLLLYTNVLALGKAGDGGGVDPAIARWTPAQQYSLQQCALEQLQRMVDMDPGAFCAAGAQGAVLDFANHENDPVLLEAALVVLQKAATDLPLRDALCEAGAIMTMLNLLCDMQTAWPEPIRTVSAIILGDLCDRNDANQALFRKADGVILLQQKLLEIRSLDPTLPSKLTLATLRAVWKCIVQSRKNLVRFLVSDGMDGLLDVLEAGHSSLYPLALSIICDILENEKAHVFFHEWRSTKTGKNSAQILVGIWQGEEAKRGLALGGQITNTRRPLMGNGVRTEWVPSNDVAYGFQSKQRREEIDQLSTAVDSEQVLRKVYTCFKLLGFPAVADSLSEDERATLAFVETYVKFKQGEFWQDLDAELSSTGTLPIEEDAMRIASGIESAEFLAETVRANQGLIIGERVDRERMQETAFYERKALQEKQELDAKTFKKDKTKLTMAERTAAKAAKEDMLKNARTVKP